MCAIGKQPDIFRQLSETEKTLFRTTFECMVKNLGDMERYLGMVLAATKDVDFVQGVVNMVSSLKLNGLGFFFGR